MRLNPASPHTSNTKRIWLFDSPVHSPVVVAAAIIAGGEQGSAGDALLPAAVQGPPEHVSEVARPKAAAAAAGQVRETVTRGEGRQTC